MRYAAILILGLVAVPLCADWKFTILSSGGGARSVQTVYYKDRLQRTDFKDAFGQLQRVTVLDLSSGRQTIWDMQSHTYSIHDRHKISPAKESGSAIVFDVESTDTGQRRTMFGHSVRRIITEERRHAEGVRLESESRVDGWYLDSGAPSGIGPQAAVLLTNIVGQGRPPIKINRRGIDEKGFPISIGTTSVIFLPDGRRQEWHNTQEVTELFEGQLDAALFKPPAGFRRQPADE